MLQKSHVRPYCMPRQVRDPQASRPGLCRSLPVGLKVGFQYFLHFIHLSSD